MNKKISDLSSTYSIWRALTTVSIGDGNLIFRNSIFSEDSIQLNLGSVRDRRMPAHPWSVSQIHFSLLWVDVSHRFLRLL